MRLRTIFLLIFMQFFINCSRSNSSSPADLIDSQGFDPAVLSKLGDNLSFDQNTKEFFITDAQTGHIHKTRVYALNHYNQPSLGSNLDPDKTWLITGFIGENVQGFASIRDFTADPDDRFHAVGLTGDPSQNLPNERFVFNGIYSAIYNDETQPHTLYLPAKFLVNFYSNSITGYNPNAITPSQEFSFRGTISSGEMRATLTDYFGTYDMHGAFYGQNGQELAAYFQTQTAAGLIYGAQE